MNKLEMMYKKEMYHPNQQDLDKGMEISPEGHLLQSTSSTEKTPPPLLCFLAGHNIKQCYGCKNKFGTGMQTPPNDMIIKLQVIRDRLVKNNWIPGWKKSWGYFHLNINCLKLEKTILEVEDIYIPNDTRVNLKPAHVKKLEAMGWWQRVKMRV